MGVTVTGYLIGCLWLGCLSGGAVPAAAEPLRLGLPIGGEPGNTCFIQNYVDHDPGPRYRDYHCGRLSYDGHAGTDFRLKDMAALRSGVPVFAGATGKVKAVRDAMADISVQKIGKEALQGRDAGNSVVIDHGEGWETQYAHLKRGSVSVRAGQTIGAGTPIGRVGLSGNTEFPHVHFEVRYQGKPVDPFIGVSGEIPCGPGNRPLWEPETLARLAYTPTAVLGVGISDHVLSDEEITDGPSPSPAIRPQAKQLVFWIKLMGTLTGDREIMNLTGPNGERVADKTEPIPGNKAEWFSFVGRKSRDKPWPPGKYRGGYQLIRSGKPLLDMTVLVDVSTTITP